MAQAKTRIVLTNGDRLEVAHGITSVKKWIFGAIKDDGTFAPPELGGREMNLGTSDDKDGPRVIVGPQVDQAGNPSGDRTVSHLEEIK